MDRQDTVRAVAELFQQTGHHHHHAYVATDGTDPEWASWYAGHLQVPLNELLGTSLSRSEIVWLLLDLDQEHQARGKGQPWPMSYAELAVERYLAREAETLALYHFESCPYCRMVRSVIAELGIEVELRDIRRDGQAYDDLIAARGRGTVPVLRCTSADGTDRWMPESRDIIRYLRDRFAK